MLTAVLCIPAAALGDALTVSRADLAPEGGGGGLSIALAAVLLCYILPASVLQLALSNTWVNNSLWFWGGLFRLPASAALLLPQALAALLRELYQFRLVSAYGVFPPHTFPPQRYAVVYEGSDDGVSWRRYEAQYQISGPRSPPRVVAPYHPRYDHDTFYEFVGLNS